MSIRPLVRAVLPDAIRIPLANRAYRILAFARRVRHRSYTFVYHSGQRLAYPHGLPTWKLPALLARRTVQALKYRLDHRLRHEARILWGWIASQRQLFNQDPRALSARSRLRRFVALFLAATPDLYYRRIFHRLERILSTHPREESATEKRGVVLAVGSLGPGGAERQATTTALGLKNTKAQAVSLVCANLSTEASRFFLSDLTNEDIPVSELRNAMASAPETKTTRAADQSLPGTHGLPTSLQEVSLYLDRLSALQPQITHLWLDEVNIKGGIAAVLLGTPRVILGLRSLPPHNFGFHQPYMREAYRWLAKKPSVRLLNNSRAGARAYEEWLGLQPGTVHVIYNGFDFDAMRSKAIRQSRATVLGQWAIPATAPVVGSVMRLSEEKQPTRWLDIAQKISRARPDVFFLIVGDGPLRSALERQAIDRGLTGRLVFAGTQKDAYSYMAAFDLFLLTSRAEGLPNVLIEAQALGVPVVTTRAGGAPETLEDRVTGWVVDETTTPGEIAQRVIALLSDTAWREAARRHMPAFLAQRFGLAGMIAKTEMLYAS
jgi:glycosyltransferase involved in cell wall biosynthesis